MKRRLDPTVDNSNSIEQQRYKLNTNEERLNLFEDWLRKHKVLYDNTEIRFAELYNGFALYSTSSEHPPDIQIPTCLLMSTESAKNSSTFTMPTSDLLEQGEEHIDQETLILSLFLLHERSKGIQSHWYPYIQLLPQTFSTPLFHKENYLESTPVFYLSQTMYHSMSEVCNLIHSHTFTLEEFLWAYTVISSRAFKIAEIGTTLIPVVDLANHVSLAREANLATKGIDKQTDRFVLTTTEKKIVQGEELCIRYNELANWQLLLYYGFAIENNAFDSVFLQLKIDPDEPYEMEMKKTLLLNLDDDLFLDHELQITEDQPIITDNLLATLRLLVMTDEELRHYTISNIGELVSSIVNVDNERRVLHKLLEILNEFKEATFTTTLEENLQRYQSTDLTDDERFSLIYLIGQKQILENALQWAQNALTQLS
ncbi:unnamed protein product [Adineta ricciae]|uniref:Rubisco LSMT substrate-binding domain-containing protein n=1 Tax=Adineta ricciae TaxID=249248 RepID=A0A816E736_ADIRI|nr:unnamed protein product [Adineta ricciae]CAF1646100.1 unnamed protein product [Adineta ricciae]